MAEISSGKLENFRPQLRNANKHTQRGMGVLETSMRKLGYVAPMTAAADGEIIDGSARAETSATVFGDDVLIVHHDGRKPVIMVRDDIESADSPEARAISIAANRIAQINLDFDAEVILEDLNAGVDLSAMYFDHELDALINGIMGEAVDPSKEWQGMPEFEQENAFAFRTIKVHFSNQTDVDDFAKLLGQNVTDKTKYIWYPKQNEMDLTAYVAHDKS